MRLDRSETLDARTLASQESYCYCKILVLTMSVGVRVCVLDCVVVSHTTRELSMHGFDRVEVELTLKKSVFLFGIGNQSSV